MTVTELEELLVKLIAEGKGDYVVTMDGYADVDTEIIDKQKELRLW